MGKKRHDLSKILRQELIMNIIENFSGVEGMTTSDIYEVLDSKCPGVNKRTLYRDLDEISRYLPIFEEERDGKRRWFLNHDCKPEIKNSIFREILRKQLLEYLEEKVILSDVNV